MDKVLEILTQFPANRQLALYNILGGPEMVEKILSSDVYVILKAAKRKLVDKHGRFIPLGLSAPVVDADYNYYFERPAEDDLELVRRFINMTQLLNCSSEIYFKDFKDRTDEILQRVKDDRQLANLLQGPYFRIILPPLQVGVDIGKTLEDIFLPAIEQAYLQHFPERRFQNKLKEELIGRVSIAEGAQYAPLLEAMSQGAVPAILFPTAFQGFSDLAAHEVLDMLSEEVEAQNEIDDLIDDISSISGRDIIMSGGYDVMAALVGYMDILARDSKTPPIDIDIFQWQARNYGLNFIANEENFCFDYRVFCSSGHHSTGVVILG
ncbi:MAG: hypothetical protein WC456_01935 [Patescibacteria group bacterium]